MAVSSLTLDGYIQAVTDFLTPLFPEVLHWGHYERVGQDTAMPAVLVQVEDFQNNRDDAPSDGRLCLEMLVSIRLLDSFDKTNIRMELRKRALKMASLINRQQFSIPVTPAEINEVSNDPFEREHDAYEVMKIEFVQSGYFGDFPDIDGYFSEFPIDENFEPQRIFVAEAPNIGSSNQENYEELKSDC